MVVLPELPEDEDGDGRLDLCLRVRLAYRILRHWSGTVRPFRT